MTVMVVDTMLLCFELSSVAVDIDHFQNTACLRSAYFKASSFKCQNLLIEPQTVFVRLNVSIIASLLGIHGPLWLTIVFDQCHWSDWCLTNLTIFDGLLLTQSSLTLHEKQLWRGDQLTFFFRLRFLSLNLIVDFDSNQRSMSCSKPVNDDEILVAIAATAIIGKIIIESLTVYVLACLQLCFKQHFLWIHSNQQI